MTACGEEILLDGCRSGHGWAWRELHRRYRPVADAFLRKLGVVDYDLEDCSQDVFLELHRHLRTFRSEAQFQTWFYRICASQARRARRRQRLAQALQESLPGVVMEGWLSTPGFSESLALQRTREAAQRLPPSLRDSFLLFEVQGLSGEAVAAALDCPEGTVWRRLHRARKAVAADLRGDNAPRRAG